ncbi:MAG TPA: hypothetical protein VFN97_10950 [Actinospica sp.]|nr:hypothetical protein [Actinospica sp.]
MIKRVFWVALGASVGIVAVNRASKAVKKLAPGSIAGSASGVPGRITAAWQDFAEDVRSAAAEREFELYRTLAVDTVEHEK